MIVVNFILVLGILIFVHELGHFLVAKWSGVRVEKFSLGFGPKLFGRQIGETEYLISAFPLGGYVKMYGEGGFSEIEMIELEYEREGTAAAPVEPYKLTEADKSRSFAHKTIAQRMAIVFAGPLFNMVFAWLLLILLYLVGMPIMKAAVGEVLPDKPAAQAGIVTGDLITAINGHKVRQWEDFSGRMVGVTDSVTLSILRNGQPVTIQLQPQLGETRNMFGETIKKPIIGVSPSYEVVT